MKLSCQVLPVLDLFIFAAEGWNVLIHYKDIRIHRYTNTILSTATKTQLLLGKYCQIHKTSSLMLHCSSAKYGHLKESIK
jgi:hypothetical protein